MSALGESNLTHHREPSVATSRSLAVVAFLVALAVSAFVYRGSWASMVTVWMESDKYQHGFVIAPMAAWAAWRMRGRLAGIAFAPSPEGMLAVAACAGLWALGAIAGVNSAMQAGAVGMVGAVTWTFLGRRTAASMAFPLGFLFFMVPVGEGASGTLMDWTADVLEFALRATGIPVLREDNEFTLPTGRWSVIEACGGLNYLIAALPLAVFCAYERFRSWTARIGFVALAVAVALLANWFRAYAVVMIGHLSNMRYGIGFDHLVYGWVLFGVVMAGVFWLAVRLSDPDADGFAAGATAPVSATPGRAAGPAIVATISVAFAAMLAASVHASGTVDRVAPRAGFVDALAKALGTAERGTLDPAPHFVGEREAVTLRVEPTAPVDVYAAYFAAQSQGRELIGYGNVVLARDNKRWKIYAESVRTLEGDPSVTVVEYLARSAEERRVIWHVYVVDGAVRKGAYRTKLASMLALLQGRGDHSAVLVASAPLRDSEPDAVRAVLAPVFQQALDATMRFTSGAGASPGPRRP
jgi:exosortase A